jgi:phosphoglycerol transferase MdoB-like AlkP superfamily enzyme
MEILAFFLILNLSLPFLIRFVLIRRLHSASAIPFYAYIIGLAEDLFIVMELSLILPLSIAGAAALGFLIHLLLLVDVFLFQKMQLRMRLTYLYHLRHARSMIQSAQHLGLKSFLWLTAAIFLLQLFGYLFLYDHTPFSWITTLLCLGLGALSTTALLLPKQIAYAMNHILFQEQIDLLFRFCSYLKRKTSPTRTFTQSFSTSSPFSGQKQFEINIAPKEKPNILFLFLESVNAHAVNSDQNAMPHFNRLAKEGIFFSDFYSNGTLTYRAMISGLFGIPPATTARGLTPYIDIPLTGLPERLKKAGYKTAFHHNGSLVYDSQREFLQKHFDEIRDRSEIADGSIGWGAPDEYLMRYSANWLEEQKHPVFLTLFTITNHHPWILPDHYKAPAFSGSPLQQRFLQTVHYTDYALNLFVERLRAKNLSKKTILFILGDHGNPMGEHDKNYYNHRFLYEENVHTPLLILADGRIENPKTIHEIGSQIDLFPTVMDLLQLNGAHPACASSLMRSDSRRKAMLQNPYSEGFIGCREESWKWIENRLSSQGELYDLSIDPQETNNLALTHSTIAERLRRETREFFTRIDDYYQKLKRSPKSTSCLPHEIDCSLTLIKDRELIEQIHPHLRTIYLKNCLLLTDHSIEFIFSHCPQLEELNLYGLTDITDKALLNISSTNNLESINLTDAQQLTDQGVMHLAQSCPNLLELHLNGHNLTDQSILAIGQFCRRLTRFKLIEGHQISDEALISVFQNNPNLGRLVLNGCSHLTDRALEFLQHLPIELLWLIDTPRITDAGISHLAKLPIRSLVFKGCPQIQKKYLVADFNNF